MIKIRKLA